MVGSLSSVLGVFELLQLEFERCLQYSRPLGPKAHSTHTDIFLYHVSQDVSILPDWTTEGAEATARAWGF
jgi:hypothetical protein